MDRQLGVAASKMKGEHVLFDEIRYFFASLVDGVPLTVEGGGSGESPC